MKSIRLPVAPGASPLRSARRRRWLRWGSTFAVFLGLCTAAWLGWRRWEMHRAAQEAVHMAQQGDFRDAEPKLRVALEYDPGNVELLRALALGLLGTGKLAEADLVLTRWCQVGTEQAEPYRLRMDLRHQNAQQLKPGAEQQRLKELALADGRRAIELDPEDDSVARNVVWLCLGSGRFEEADRVCRRCRERQPDDPWVVYLQARVCHARGAPAEARDLLDR